MPESALTCIDLWCKAGSSFEDSDEKGMAHFLEHMIFKGSSKLREGEFDLKIEALGGSSNAATGFDDVHFYVLVPSEGVEQAIKLLIELVLCPSIMKNAYSLEREVVLEEIAQQSDQPDEKVFQMVLEGCWSNHPYGKSILGNASSLNASTPNRMKLFHQRLYKPENCVLSIAGKSPRNLLKILSEGELGKQVDKSNPNNSKPNSKKLNFNIGRKIVEVKRLESARLVMAWPVPPASEQFIIMGYDIATTLLGEGRRSRLVNNLREEQQIVESIEMDLTALEQGGLVLLEACCIEKNLNKVEDSINQILIESINSPPSERETKRAKELVRNGFCFSLEHPAQVAAITGTQTLWNRHQPLLEPLKDIDGWSSSMIQEEIFSCLQPSQCFTLIAKPLSS